MGYELTDLVPVVAELTEKLTSKESTSVTYETARQLMEAVLYCIREFESAGRENRPAAEEPVPARMAYRLGYEMVMDKVRAAKRQYNEMIPEFKAYGNENYRDTVTKALPGFFKYYDVGFAPQNTIITMDYPVLCPVFGLEGIHAVKRYVESIWAEQKFLQQLPEEYVLKILYNFHPDYQKQFFNVCSIVLRHLLGCMAIGKKTGSQDVSEDYEKLGCLADQYKKDELVDMLGKLLKRLIEKQYNGDKVIFEYLCLDLDNFAAEFKHAAQYKCIDKIIVFV